MMTNKYQNIKKQGKPVNQSFYAFLILAFVTTLGYGQARYNLGNYQIDPQNRTISVLTGFDGTDKDIHYWGQHYIPDSTIDFDSTILFVIGNQFVLKEHISKNWNLPPQLDLNTFRIIQSDLEKGSICRDKNFLYKNPIGTEHQSKWEFINLTGYQTINDFIYDKDNTLYFLSNDFKLKEIRGVKPHIPSLNHIIGNYFADKHGLYYFGGFYTKDLKAEETKTGLVIWRKEWGDYFYDKSIKLETNRRKDANLEIRNNYFIYCDSLYVENSPPKALPLNVNKLKKLEIGNSSYANYKSIFLTDGEHTFVTVENGGYVTLESRYKDYWLVSNPFFQKEVNRWQVINQKIFSNEEGKTMYFPSGIKQDKAYMGVLVEKQNDFYSFTLNKNDTLTKFNQVLIFNFDTQEYETIDLTQYRYLSEDLWIYKNRLYITDKGLATKENIETENLHYISLHDINTNYLKNDSSLIYVGNLNGYSTLGENGKAMQVLGNRIVSKVDFTTLKVITANILIDKNNIYTGDYKGVNVVPIAELGIDIKVFAE